MPMGLDGEIGRHSGLKIRRLLDRSVPVRFRLEAPGNTGANRHAEGGIDEGAQARRVRFRLEAPIDAGANRHAKRGIDEGAQARRVRLRLEAPMRKRVGGTIKNNAQCAPFGRGAAMGQQKIGVHHVTL